MEGAIDLVLLNYEKEMERMLSQMQKRLRLEENYEVDDYSYIDIDNDILEIQSYGLIENICNEELFDDGDCDIWN